MSNLSAALAKVSSLKEKMRAEFNAWENALSFNVLRSADLHDHYPTIFTDQGLPAGWQLRAHSLEPCTSATETLYVLTSRDKGGWALLRQNVNSGGLNPNYTIIKDYEADLEGVYAYACGASQSYSIESREWGVPTEQMMRTFIATHYNLDDPTEAAEATLVALGASPRLIPASLA